MHLSQIYVFPIKSCRGITVPSSAVIDTGLQHDRLLMLVDENNAFLSQRQLPMMARLVPTLPNEGQITVRMDGTSQTPLTHQISYQHQPRAVTIWSDRVMAIDQGDRAARWFSDALQKSVRLVAMNPDAIAADQRRGVDPMYAVSRDDVTGFADGYPMLVVSQSALDALNERLPHPVGMDRFRPNLVVADCPPHAEDQWTNLRMGDIDFSAVKPCQRCQVPNVDQQRGVIDDQRQPNRELARYRRAANGVFFGMNLIHRGNGTLSVGDVVTLLE
ncbi:MAG: MOSC N-terminal beta barrel domain-containing protein [Planctomycetota bacterium]